MVGFCVLLKGVSEKWLENYIMPHDQAGKSLFVSHSELDLSIHTVPKQSGSLVMECSVDISL